MALNSFARLEHAQRFNWAFLFAQNSSIQSKNTVLHLPKSRCITVSRVIAARDNNPPRELRFVATRAFDNVGLAVRANVVRADVVRVTSCVLVVAARDTIFLFVDVRAEFVEFDAVLDFTVVEFLGNVDCVCRTGEFCERVEFFATAATAPSQIGTAKHAAKNRFRAFISFLV